MAIVVGLCGLSGVGKSTLRQHLVEKTVATGIYLGGAVLDEVRRRRLPETRESEKLVRLALREENRAVMVERALEGIKNALMIGLPVIVDAILLPEELHHLQTSVPEARVHILKVQADLEDRLARLSQRSNRPLTAQEINDRDSLELNNLRTDKVLDLATHAIYNKGSKKDFLKAIDELWPSIRSVH